MKNAIKWAALLGVGYYLLRDQIGHFISQIEGGQSAAPASPAATPAPTTMTTTAPSSPAPSVPTTPQSAQTTRDLLLAWARPNAFYVQQNGLMNAWQWAYGYHAIRGGSQDLASMFQDPARLMTIDEFLSVINANGLNGLPLGWRIA